MKFCRSKFLSEFVVGSLLGIEDHPIKCWVVSSMQLNLRASKVST